MLEINNYTSNILKDITFSLNEDENLIILGRNGAGKSTLAKVLCNLITNDNVKLFDKKLNELAENLRASFINYIPPKFEIFDEYVTLKEFLELSFIKEVKKEKIEEVLNILCIKHLENKPCISFSSGEKQLCLLASAILHDAKITIFDELTANLDITRLKEVYEILNSKYLKQKIVITHNLDLAYALKYKVLYIDFGEIKFFGSNEEFFSEENLQRFYNDSILKVDNHLVVNL